MGKWATYRNRGGSGGPGVIESYLARVAAAGGTMDATGTAAVTELYSSLARAGVWGRLSEVWPCVGTNLQACLQKLKVQPGAPAAYANVNFALIDYIQTGGGGGLTGDGTSKSLFSGPTPVELGLDCSLFVACRAGFSGLGNRFLAGSTTGTDQYELGSLNPAASVTVRLGSAVPATIASPAVPAYWQGVRETPTSIILYQDGFPVASSATLATAPVSTHRAALFATNSSGAHVSFVAARLTGAAWGLSLTPSQVFDLASLWGSYDALLGR